MEDILKLIKTRKSDRGLFDPRRKVARQDIEQILEAGSWAPTAHNMQNFEIVAVDDEALLNRISRVESRVSPEFIRENYRQLLFSQDELKQKKTGLIADSFPPLWVTPEAAQGIMPDAAPEPLGRLVQAGPALLFVLYDPSRRAPASEGDFLGAVSLGCVLENMWLMAHALGISLHVMSSLAAPDAARELKGILGIPENLEIVFALRLGYPVAIHEHYLRVRRDVEDFTHFNRY